MAPYFDLSFQHASGRVLRAMRRFGDGDRFLALIEQIRRLAPEAGIRSNFIVGFPGETEADVAELERFLSAARLDAIGIFGYSDEDGTEAATLPGQLSEDEIASRVERVAGLADELMDQRAADRIGEIARGADRGAGRRPGEQTASTGPAGGTAAGGASGTRGGRRHRGAIAPGR